MEEFDSVSTSLTDGSPRAKIEVDPVLSGAYGVTPSEVLSQVSNKLSGMSRHGIHRQRYRIQRCGGISQ